MNMKRPLSDKLATAKNSRTPPIREVGRIADRLQSDPRLDTIAKVATVLDHESRNLLGALKTCVQILRRNPQLSTDDREILEVIESGSNRLGEIVGQFSAFKESQQPCFAAVKLHPLIEQTAAALKRDERCAQAIVIERSFDSAIDAVTADGAELRQILWQLFLNAAQAMGAAGTLTLQTERAGAEIIIRVKDTGPGIPPSLRRLIYEPFYSTKTRGAGLGLAIVKRFVEQHGGGIAVESDHGKGASFTIRLPIEQKIEPAALAGTRSKNDQ
ncbi:MAG: two-component system sensor histidine kinase NtrB [Candidatus Binatia bacterium]